MYRDPSWLDFLLFLAVVAVTIASMIKERLGSDPDPLEQTKRAYENGEIDHAEYERRIEFHLDDRNEQIRTVVEDVNGVGEATSKEIAREFESLDELRKADHERLEEVNGVGEKTADAVLERV